MASREGQVGANWAAGSLSIAEEHRASAICERLLAIRSQQPPGRPRGTAVAATPPGERHGLPAHRWPGACLTLGWTGRCWVDDRI